MKTSMKEVIVTEPFHYEVREVPIPTPGPDEVLIQMKAAGVCGSDVHIYKGENPCSSYPLVPGHENVGVIAAVGENCKNIHVGDHVVVDLIITCEECFQCTHGRGNVCESVLVRGSGTDGGWREYFTAPESDVYPIDKTLPWKDAVLIEPLAIGEHCTKRGRVCPDDTVFIFGAGTIGTIICQACKGRGAKKIIVCDINDEALERVKLFGADATINSKKEDLHKRVAELTDGHLCNVAFDAAAFPGSLSMVVAPGILANAGRVVPMGFSADPETISQADINKREIDIIGSRMSLEQFVPTAQKMSEGAYRLDGIATHFFSFRQIEQVFEKMLHPDPTVKKMVILFDEEDMSK